MLSFYKQKIGQWDWYDVEEVSSTNDEIKKLVSENINPFMVISAKYQTGGRGRRGRHWQSIEGNLYFTYSLKIKPHELSQVVCLIGLSLSSVVKNLAPQKRVQIKWPNDVFLEGHKLSGILLENIKEDLWGIGIGVNIQGAPELKEANYKATSLKDNGIILDRKVFLQYYLENFTSSLELYKKEGFTSIKKQWLERAMNYKQKITVKTEKEEKTGVFVDLDDNGYLILETSKGRERITAGDLFI